MNKDFTLDSYINYLEILKTHGYYFYRYDEYMQSVKLVDKYCLIRHDVDRKPKLSLEMAQIEKSLNIKSTYYFRAKNNTFKPNIIKKIESLGHEIGYHYESLSDTNGSMEDALQDFTLNLKKFRNLAKIKTCSMHGRPFKKHDNRDLWKIKKNHDYLINELKMVGEVYLDIDYTDIAYINDTGRNWTSGKSNIRDRVSSKISADFSSSAELTNYFKKNPHKKIVFQIHPERWSNNFIIWQIQNLKDNVVNLIKKIIYYGNSNI
jgi:hypothetical protein